MKWIALVLLILTVVLGGIAYAVGRFGGGDSRADLDALPWEVITLVSGVVLVLFLVAWALVRLFSS